MCEAGGKGLEFGPGLLARDAGLEAGKHLKVVLAAISRFGQVGRERRGVAERDPELGVEDLIGAVEGGRYDTGDCVCVAGEGDCLSGDVGVCVEAATPESSTKDDLLRVLLAADETAPEDHGELCDREEVGRDSLTPDTFGFAVAADGSGDELVVGGYAGKGLRLIAQVGVDGIGKAVAALVAVVRGVNGEECGGVAHGGGAQDEAVDRGKDCSVSADAESDGENGDGGCAAMLGEGAQGVEEIAQKRFEPGQRAAFTMGLAGLLCSADTDEGLAARFCGGEAGADEVVGMERDVGLEFGGEVGVGGAGAEEAEKTMGEGSQFGHGCSLGFADRGEETGEDGGGLLPIRGGFFQLALPGFG